MNDNIKQHFASFPRHPLARENPPGGVHTMKNGDVVQFVNGRPVRMDEALQDGNCLCTLADGSHTIIKSGMLKSYITIRIPSDREFELKAELKKLQEVVDAARKWKESRTEYLITVEMALSMIAPSAGAERYHREAAASSRAASDLVAALHRLDK